MHILRFNTVTRGLIEEDTFEHFPVFVLCDDVLEGLVGKGCSRTEDGIGYGLGELLVHDGIGFQDFSWKCYTIEGTRM